MYTPYEQRKGEIPFASAEYISFASRNSFLGVPAVTMDQLMVDCGDDPVGVGDEVVLLGRQGDEEVRAEEWAAALDTIGYEITCAIGPRVPRRYL